MKILTLNFLTCAVKACKSSSASFPLHPKDCSLVSDTIAPNPKLLLNILPRVDWEALIVTASEVRPLPPPKIQTVYSAQLTTARPLARFPLPATRATHRGGPRERS